MSTSLAALYVSIGSFLIAAFALGWNVYRDVVLKPRVRVSLNVSEIVVSGQGSQKQVVALSCVNLGPGDVFLKSVFAQNTSFWIRLTKRRKGYFVMHERSDGYGGSLPTRIGVGETLNLFWDYEPKCLLIHEFTKVGVVDSFGRAHWARRNQVERARRQYRADFPDEKL